jgi:hypothetical protein
MGARAQEAPETLALQTEGARMESVAESQGGSQVESKIAAQFSDFLGADAGAIVHGLRTGEAITEPRRPIRRLGRRALRRRRPP